MMRDSRLEVLVMFEVVSVSIKLTSMSLVHQNQW